MRAFLLTAEQIAELDAAGAPVEFPWLGRGLPEQRVDEVWAQFGRRMGFDPESVVRTVEPRLFYAEPTS